MQTIRITRDGRLTLPAELRRELRLQPGQRLFAVAVDGLITLVPVPTVREARGFLPGLESSVDRADRD